MIAERPRGIVAAAVAAVMLLAAAGAFLMYRHTAGYGFHYDDYHFVRPYAAAEVRAAFAGPWDPSGIEVPFYRPLTIAFYAARFELFGINSRAVHLLSLWMFACAAALVAALAWRLTGRVLAALLAGTVFAVHPAMPYSLVAWTTNQMHLLELLIVLIALLWWTAVRDRRAAAWLPLLPLAAAAFMVKEDGVMLLPAILTLHALGRRVVEPELPPAPRTFVAAAVVLVAALVAARAVALHDTPGGYAFPGLERAWLNYWRGLDRVFRLVPADRPWQAWASAFATAAPVAALAAWKAASRPARYGLLAGAAIAALFNLPFVFVTKSEQMHLVSTGAALALAGSLLALFDIPQRRAFRVGLGVLCVAGLAASGAVARDISRDFEPYGPVVLAMDRVVTGWAAVPAELRGYLHDKLEPGPGGRPSPNPADALPAVAFGLRSEETGAGGWRYRWMSGSRIQILVAGEAREITIPLRHEAGAFREPATARITSDGRLADEIRLDDGSIRASRIPLRRTGTDLSGMHRLTIAIDHAWIPASVIPGSSDMRTLGLQVGPLEVR